LAMAMAMIWWTGITGREGEEGGSHTMEGGSLQIRGVAMEGHIRPTMADPCLPASERAAQDKALPALV
jgi:hypothetical protein